MDVACAGLDQEGHEGPAARPEGTEYLDDRGFKCKAWSSAYTSFCGQQHRGFFPPLYQAAKEDQPFTQEDRCDGQPQRPPQQDREGGVRRQMVQLPIPASLELRT